MNHHDHKNLIKDGIQDREGIWADLGSGEGAFTLALADLLHQKSKIISIDKKKESLAIQKEKFKQFFPQQQIEFLQTDFTQNLHIPKLDGIILANSLHFIKRENQGNILKQIRNYLKKEARIITVEYNTDNGNVWVPYPFQYKKCVSMLEDAGFKEAKLLATIKSEFLNEIYACGANNEESIS